MLNDVWTLLKACPPKEGGIAGSTAARVRDEQSLKQNAPKLVTFSGIVIEVRDKQSEPNILP